MKQINVKKLALLNLPYVFLGLYASKLGQAWRLAAGADASEKLLHIMDGFAAAFQSALTVSAKRPVKPAPKVMRCPGNPGI